MLHVPGELCFILVVFYFRFILITRQKLEEGDPVQRMAFCNRLVHTVEQSPQFLDQLIVSDEAIFSLNSEVDTRNVIKYAPYGNGHPADHYVEFAQGADKVMVWVGLTGAGVALGPHFAERNLDTREYLRIIRYNVIQREFDIHNIGRNNMWWQQDGAPLLEYFFWDTRYMTLNCATEILTSNTNAFDIKYTVDANVVNLKKAEIPFEMVSDGISYVEELR